MSQRHAIQEGATFHITTNTRRKIPWLTAEGIPRIVIDNLVMTRNIQRAEIFAFCILPDHMHILIRPGEQGLSKFMHSFKRNSAWHINQVIPVAEVHEPQLRNVNHFIWQKGFHDERIQSDKQRSHAWRYITENALHHGLTETIEDWPWTSLHWEHLLDPMEW